MIAVPARGDIAMRQKRTIEKINEMRASSPMTHVFVLPDLMDETFTDTLTALGLVIESPNQPMSEYRFDSQVCFKVSWS